MPMTLSYKVIWGPYKNFLPTTATTTEKRARKLNFYIQTRALENPTRPDPAIFRLSSAIPRFYYSNSIH